MKKKRWILLLTTVLLLGLTVTLGRCDADDGGDSSRAKQEVEFPRSQWGTRRSKTEWRKNKTAKDAPAEVSADGARPQPAQTVTSLPADAFERAFSRPQGGGEIVLEVNAIRNSELVDKIMRCRAEEVAPGLETFRQQLGIDLEKDIDRVAIADETFVMSGYFDQLHLPDEVGEPQQLDAQTKLYTFTVPADDGDGEVEEYVAIMDDQLLVSSRSRESLDQALARVNGDAPALNTQRYDQIPSEIVGRLDRTFIAELLGDSQDPLAQKLSEAIDKGLISANIDDQIAISADLEAGDPEQAQDLARAMAGALAALRLQAQQQGDEELASLLEQARVRHPGDEDSAGSTIEIDLAVPGQQVLRMMGCDDSGRPVSAPTHSTK